LKTVRIILSPEAEEIYTYLNQESARSHENEKRIAEARIFDAFNKKIELIKVNFHYGQPIGKSKIPESYRVKYGITNLFWVELPHFWRFLYTLKEGESEIEIIAFVLDIMDHKEYNKKMSYKNR